MSKPKTLIVTIPGMISEKDLEPLSLHSDVEYCELDTITEDALAEKCFGKDYLMLNMDVVPKQGDVKISGGFYSKHQVKNLKSVAVDMTGVDYFSPNAAKAAGINLQNIPHYSSRSVAESILAEVLLHSRQRHLAYVDEITGKKVTARKGINLHGRTAGIIGYGSIGATVKAILEGVGMKVKVWNRSPKQNLTVTPLEEIAASSDVICISLATVTEGDDSNVGVIDHELLRNCKETIIINLANELLVDSEAMIEALKSGRVSAYSVEGSSKTREKLSVFPNVHFPPSNAWNSDESMDSLRETWVSNVVSAIKGSPENCVF